MPSARALRPIRNENLADLQRWYPLNTSKPAPPDDTFEIALVLAGGQSAGCYLAGVLDFLFQALDCWYEARQNDPAGIPNHNVVIKTIVGASAGGLNTAIAAVAAPYRFRHASQPDFERRAENLGSPFYRAWVHDIDIAHLLATDDLAGGDGGPASVLNSAYLSGKVASYIDFTGDGRQKPEIRAWLQDPLPVRIMASNLDGVPYRVRFIVERDRTTDSGGHEMSMHRDHLAFLRPLFADPVVPHFPDHELMPAENSATDPGWDRLGLAALATVAFPFALAERSIERPSTDYEYRFFFPFHAKGLVFSQPFPGVEAKQVRFVALDGGVMDNEPFTLAHATLAGSEGENKRAGEEAKRAVILVDPFIAPERRPAQDGPTPLARLPGRIWNALKSQARFKPIDLALAADGDVYSRFMIAPVRRTGDRTIRSDRALACHPLDAFLGYFSEHYRHHDFMLGRNNCYRFLRNWLVLPSTHQTTDRAPYPDPQFGNTLFARWPQAALDNPAFRSQSDARENHRQIIPLLGAAAVEPAVYDWPAGKFEGWPAVADRVAARVDALYARWRPALLRSWAKGRVDRFFAGLIVSALWRLRLRRRLLAGLREMIDKARSTIDADEDLPAPAGEREKRASQPQER